MSNLGFSGSYATNDVTFLLKPVVLEPTDVATKERLIQSGARHYSEMLSPEAPPTPAYLALYDAALARNGARLAQDIAALAATLNARHPYGAEIVLVSLVRAGTPIGVLLARALRRLGRIVPHYAVSIIRDRGIDQVALAHVTLRHDPGAIVFVDGWTGKGAIAAELRSSIPASINPFLVVIADPAGVADMAATHDDYLIASGLLNAVVSGLVSRSILNPDLTGADDFHACVMLDALTPFDRSRAFVDHIDGLARTAASLEEDLAARAAANAACNAMVETILAETGSSSRNLIKPGIAEATRVLLRRVPELLYVRDVAEPDVQHLLHLAAEKSICVQPLTDPSHFRAVAVIRTADT
jgi:Phosphoribosyl transferase (PRTase)/PELOTA RNA binding domain